jgi:hypothetical protein
MQLCTNKHNFLSNCLIKLKFYQKSSDIFFFFFFLSWLKFQVDHSLLRLFNKGYKLFLRFCYIFLNNIRSSLPLINDAINNSIVKYRDLIPRLDDIFNECMNLVCLVRLIWKMVIIKLRWKKGYGGKNNFKIKYELFKWFVILFSLTIVHGNLMTLINHI